jgi:mono/diheme cytochrome c family protein/outer membrane murein-binding lipoprotein Lpp
MAQAYQPDEERSLSRTFFVLSLILVIASLYTVVDETFVRRPWKRYQTTFYALEYDKLRADLQAKEEALLPTQGDLAAKIQQAQAALDGNAQYRKAREELARIKNRLADVSQEQQFAKSRLDAEYYQYKQAEHAGDLSTAARYKARVDQLEQQIADLETPVAELKSSMEALQAEIKAAEAPLDEIEAERRIRLSDYQRVRERMDKVMPPIMPGLRVPKPPEIQQVVITGLNTTNFNEPLMRVDRCQTCHMGIDRPGFEGAPQPYATHPHRDVLLAHHPVERFGCTICHAGQGVALTVHTAHGELHLLDQTPRLAEPLLTDTWLQSQCRKCHQPELPALQFSSAVAHGQKLFETMGCPGCHLAQGYEQQAKVAPDLRRVASKVEPSWLVAWIKEPKAYWPATKMPNFRLSWEESEAAAAYLLSSSMPYNGPPYPGNGDVAAGKKLVEEVGCLGCHQINGTGNAFAPDLSQVAGKVKADWLFAWVKNPQEYLPHTKMPNLRLSDEEAAHITAYLMTLGAKTDRPGFAQKLADNKVVEAGNRLIGRYGCYGCHEIYGMEAQPRIGAELTTYADKRPWEMVFGDVPLVKKRDHITTPIERLISLYNDGKQIEESWEGWTYGKMKDSRMYATDRILQQMPDFAFSDADASTLLLLLRSFADERLPASYVSTPSEAEALRVAGTGLFEKYNCLGCHNLAGQGGTMAPNLVYEGSKARGDWLLSFLRQPHQIRPLMQARMPTFPLTEQEAVNLRDYIMTAFLDERVPKAAQVAQVITPDLAAQGEKLYWEKYPCFTCHQIQGKVGGAAVGPDLTNAWKRLNPDWMVQWIKNPQGFDPATLMPNLGVTDAEAIALVAYLESVSRQMTAQAESAAGRPLAPTPNPQ